jgi:hypothetical protein
MKKILLYFTFFCSFFSLGCEVAPFLVAPIITGVVYWKNGEAKKYYNENQKVLHRSSINALNELQIPITRDIRDNSGNYSIVAGDKDEFKISVNRLKNNISEITVRVNFMGNKEYSELIFEKIDSYTNTIDYDESGKPTKKFILN